MDYKETFTRSTEQQNVTILNRSLEDVNFEIFIQNRIPVIVYLILVCIIGVVGNTHAIIVYSLSYKPSNHRTLIIGLALVDLAACCLSVPFEAFELRFEYTFTSSPLCKTFRFLNHMTAAASGFLLGVIAVERHRKICRPMQWQISQTTIKATSVVTVILAGVVSIPAFIVYGPNTMKISEMPELNLFGSDCTVLAQYEKSILFKAFVASLLFLTTLVFIVCLIIYIMVGKAIYRQIKFRQLSQMSSKVPTDKTNSHNSHTEDLTHSQLTHDDDSSENESSSNRFTIKHNKKKGMEKKHKKRKSFNRSKRITLMFLVATAISYLSYFPNIFLVGLKAVNKPLSRLVEHKLGGFYLLLLRSYFISNITNPIVYCFVDDRFRRECVSIYRKLHSCCFQKRNYSV